MYAKDVPSEPRRREKIMSKWDERNKKCVWFTTYGSFSFPRFYVILYPYGSKVALPGSDSTPLPKPTWKVNSMDQIV